MIGLRKIQYITKQEDVRPAVADIMRFRLRCWDTETYNDILGPNLAFDPLLGAKVRLSQWGLPNGTSYVFDMYHVNPNFHSILFSNPGTTTVGHNLKFDVKFAQHWWKLRDFGNLFCTMNIAKVLALGEVSVTSGNRFDLQSVCFKYSGSYVDKEEQTSDWSTPELSEKQIRYAANDTIAPLKLFERFVPLLRETGQVRVAELENEIIDAVALMELNGLRLDTEAWHKQCRVLDLELEETLQTIQTLLAPVSHQPMLFNGGKVINPASPKQVIEALQAKGIPVPINRQGNFTTDKTALKEFEGQYPEIDALIEYKRLAKRNTSYGIEWFEKINPRTKRIHANFHQIGAETGRFSCSKPNLQQIPTEDVYRNCIISDEGWLIIGTDYSQMELRILAEYCRDKNLLNAYDNDLDLHSYAAHLLWDIPLEEVKPKNRSIAKNQNFRIVYGGGPLGLSEATGITFEEACEIVDRYNTKAFPEMYRWLEWQAAQTIRTRQARTMTGRVRKYIVDYDDNQQKAKVGRNGKNLPIQGTSVDITKRAMALIHKQIKHRNDIKMINVVHDEILLEAKINVAREAEEINNKYMLLAEREYLYRVPCKVDSSITTCWTKDATPKQILEAKQLMGEI